MRLPGPLSQAKHPAQLFVIYELFVLTPFTKFAAHNTNRICFVGCPKMTTHRELSSFQAKFPLNPNKQIIITTYMNNVCFCNAEVMLTCE